MQILKKIGVGALLLFPFLNFAQKAFYTVYSSGNFDIGEGICQLPDSSYLVTGSSGGFNTMSAQAFVMKVSKTGDQIWTVDKGGSESETGRRIFYINDTIFLFGRTNSYGNSFDYYFLKLDTLGATIEEKTFGSTEYDWLQDVVFIPKDSSFVIYGYQLDNNGFNKKRQLIKINRAGDIVWQLEHPMHLEARLKNMHIINDTVFAVTGNEYNTQRGHFDGLLKLYLYDGTLLDSITYGDALERDYCFNDVDLFNDRYFILGTSEKTENEEVFYDCKIWKYLPSGIDYTFGGLGENYKSSLEYLAKKKFNPLDVFVVERAKIGSFLVYPDGYYDEQVMLFYGQYDMFWQQTIVNVSKEGNDITNQVVQTLDGGLILVGYKEYFGNFAQNVSLLKIGPDNETVASSSIPVEEPLLKIETLPDNVLAVSIYPNPANNIVNVNTEFMDSVDIFNMEGKRVLNSTSSTINVSELGEGIYLMKISLGEYTQIVKFVKY